MNGTIWMLLILVQVTNNMHSIVNVLFTALLILKDFLTTEVCRCQRSTISRCMEGRVASESFKVKRTLNWASTSLKSLTKTTNIINWWLCGRDRFLTLRIKRLDKHKSCKQYLAVWRDAKWIMEGRYHCSALACESRYVINLACFWALSFRLDYIYHFLMRYTRFTWSHARILYDKISHFTAHSIRNWF